MAALAIAALAVMPSSEGRWPVHAGGFALCLVLGPAGLALAFLAARSASGLPRGVRLVASVGLFLFAIVALLILAVNLGKISP